MNQLEVAVYVPRQSSWKLPASGKICATSICAVHQVTRNVQTPLEFIHRKAKEMTELNQQESTGLRVVEAGDKLKALLRSRRFWTCVAATAVTGVLYSMGEIDGGQFTSAVTLIAGIYIGSVAIEDGLRNLITVWLQEPESD